MSDERLSGGGGKGPAPPTGEAMTYCLPGARGMDRRRLRKGMRSGWCRMRRSEHLLRE